MPRAELLTRVWGYAATSQTRAVDTTMARLRRKVERDGSDPEHLLSVTGVGYRFVQVAEAEPEVAQVVPVASSVPRHHDTFVGREQVHKRTLSELVPGAVVTLAGAGGMGKSRLAAEVSRTLEVERPLRWITLQGATTLADVGARVSMIVGSQSTVDVAGGLVAVWAVAPDAVWVFDDADGVVDVLAAQLPQWRERVPGASWLITSRRSTGVAGERVVSLGPLAFLESRSLFDDRCRGDRPRSDSEKAVDELIQLLDGHPLAIELAAGRARTLGASALLNRSQTWLDLLADRRHQRPARHSSLRAALDASWDGLSEEGRFLWVRLSELACTVDVELVDAIAGFDGLTGLEDLDEHSLLHREDGFWRMPQVVRAYGRERLEALDHKVELRAAVTDAVFRYGESLCDALDGSNIDRPVQALLHLSSELERQQRVAATPDAVARAFLILAPALTLSGLDPERVAQRRALAAEVGPARRAEVCAVVSRQEMSRERGQADEDRAQALADEGLALAREHNLPHVLADVLRTHGFLERNRGNFDKATACLEEAAQHSRMSGRPEEESMALGALGLVNARQGLPFDEEMLRAIHVASAGGCDWSHGTVAGWYANLLDSHGRAAEAMAYADIALKSYHAIGDASRAGWLGLRLVAGWRQRGQWEYAVAWLDDALGTFMAVPSCTDRPLALSHRAALAHNIGDLDHAEDLARQTIEASQDALLPATEALGHLILAEVAMERGRQTRAVAHATLANELGSKHNSASIRILIALGVAVVTAWGGEPIELPEPDTSMPRVLREHARRATLAAALAGQREVAERWLALAESMTSAEDICVLADLAAVRELLAGQPITVRDKEGWASRMARRALAERSAST